MPQLKLTEERCKELQPEAGAVQTDYHDAGDRACVLGLALRVGHRTKTFRVARRVNGRMVRSSLGHWPEMSVAEARKAARKTLGIMEEGINPNASKPSGGKTLSQALEHHISKMERGENRRGKPCSPHSIRTVRGSVELHLKDWLDRPIVEVTREVLRGIVTKIESEAERIEGSNSENPPGRACSNRVLANFNALWESAEDEWGLPVKNPTPKLAALKARGARISDDDLPAHYAKVMAMVEHETPTRRVRGDLQLFALFCGVRTDGIRHLRWDDVDFDENVVYVRLAKGDKPYAIAMTATLREILERRQADNKLNSTDEKCKPWVFPSPEAEEGCVAEVKERENVYDADGDVVDRVKTLPGIQVARATYLSIAKDCGVRLEDRKLLANHAVGSDVTEKHYTFSEDLARLRDIAVRVEAAIWERIRSTKPAKKKPRHLRAA